MALSLAWLNGQAAGAAFRFQEVDGKSLGIWEGEKPVLVYNYGIMHKSGVPEDRARSTYIHPLYGLDGEVLTDDFPKDHYHHRGIFWAWPHVRYRGKEYDLWMLKGVEQRFEKWLQREAKGDRAVLEIQNGWIANGKKIMDERVKITAHPAQAAARAIDLEFVWTPVSEPISLLGAEGKSYGGLTIRYGPRTNTIITTPLGNDAKDLPMTKLAWADLTGQFDEKSPKKAGVAIFVRETHPDFPPMWLTRHYGALCLGWPGVEATTFQPGVPIRCEYRVWVHRDQANGEQLRKAYDAYNAEKKTLGK
jgi:hypothetical protein